MMLTRRHCNLILVLLCAILFANTIKLSQLVGSCVVGEGCRNLCWLHVLQDPDPSPDRLYLGNEIVMHKIGGRRQVVNASSPVYGLAFPGGQDVSGAGHVC